MGLADSAWRPTGRTAAAGSAALALGGWLANAPVVARAQPIDPARPTTIVVGVPAGARTDRVDTARTGLSRTPLPASGLHAEWRVSAGAPLEHAPLVDARGSTYVVSARGEAIAIARDGTERWRVSTGASDPGPAALLSDDTLVLVDDVSGDALGGARGRRALALARRDRGFDEPRRRCPWATGASSWPRRATWRFSTRGATSGRGPLLPEPAAAPLLWAAGKVVADRGQRRGLDVDARGRGAVPGGELRLPHRGRRGARGRSHVCWRSSRARPASRRSICFAPAPRASHARSRRAVSGSARRPCGATRATLAVLGPASELAVTVDASGRELARALLAGRLPSARADGGAPAAAAG